MKEKAPVFDRLNDQARMIIIDARQAARDMKHHHLGPEHFLAALTRDTDTAEPVKATRILTGAGFQQDKAVDMIRACNPAARSPLDGPAPFSQAAEALLEEAGDLADSFHHRQVSAEHLLLAITGLSNGPAPALLAMFGVTIAVRRDLVDWLVFFEEEPEREELTGT